MASDTGWMARHAAPRTVLKTVCFDHRTRTGGATVTAVAVAATAIAAAIAVAAADAATKRRICVSPMLSSSP